ncbi:ABC transporter ATP-binding protein [Corynebacterium cystitidis]|uniref:ABC transporter ATP-binding protein n=1 Tax=Corynebacterium cystitidis TaxID=35757 RepID=UPI00211DC474|nr:ABC transporter ATP-binding protein [Corynebacterium cystitidis]
MTSVSLSPAIQAGNLSYHHAMRRDPAFHSVDWVVQRGEAVLLTGDSGAGKSTLLHLIAGLLNDNEEGSSTGRLEVNGTVGMVLQDPDSQMISSRVGDDVAFGCENLGVPRDEIWARVTTALELVGLDVPLNHPTVLLSGGQKQRLALAGVLAMGADVLVFDEPTANLDPEGTRSIIEATARVLERTGATLVVVEHNPGPWLALIDSIYRLGSDGLEAISANQLPGPPDLPVARSASGAPWAVRADELLTDWGPPRSLELPEGYSTVMTGANGTGKTTLATTLAGLSTSNGGTLEYAESIRQGLTAPPVRWSSRHLAQRIGYVFQDPEHQFVARTVYDELKVSGAPSARIDELLQRLRLDHVVQAHPFTLSGGEKRRLSVATALVNTPAFVVLDEPTFGQDARTFVELVGLIRSLTDQGTTVLSITHDEHFTRSLGDHQVVVT